jgi:hypothetical protein
MNSLGRWFRERGEEKAKGYFLKGAELGWTSCMDDLAKMLNNGEGREKDLRQAAIWGAKGNSRVFWSVLSSLKLSDGKGTGLDSDFSQVCYSLGWGLFWHQYGRWGWNNQSDEQKMFANRCLDYYCSCVELQQKSIFTFLLCWKESVGVKDVGLMVAKRVWEGREEKLLKSF